MTVAVSLLLCAASGQAQEDTLSADEAVRLAVERSPSVQAAQARLSGAAATLKGAGAPFNPLAEVAPGVGFTNGNAMLSQQIDIGGRRGALRRAAGGQQEAAQAGLDLARRQAAAEARTLYFDLARAREVERAAVETAKLAASIRDLVRRRVEIGEAPAVQVTRAEIEVARAEQEVARAQGDVRGRAAALNIYLGRAAADAVTPTDRLAIPEAPAESRILIEQARAQRPELAVARGLIRARQGEVQVARSQRRPELFAEAAADIWSLDRDPLRSRNLGLQARLSFPLFDRGSLRAGVDRAQAGVEEQEAELRVAERTVTLEVERAAANLAAARVVALGYAESILPQSEALLAATQKGFESGLSSFLDVLEAQRVARQTRTEYLSALFDAARARVNLDQALGAAPGLPAAPAPERKQR